MRQVVGWRSEMDGGRDEAGRRLGSWLAHTGTVGADAGEIGGHIARGLAALVDARAVLVLSHAATQSHLEPLVWHQAASAVQEAHTHIFDVPAAVIERAMPSAFSGTLLWHDEISGEWRALSDTMRAYASDQLFAPRAHRLVSLIERDENEVSATEIINSSENEPIFTVLDSENSVADIVPAPSSIRVSSNTAPAETNRIEASAILGNPPALLVFLPARWPWPSVENGASFSGTLSGVALVWLESEDGLVPQTWREWLELCARQAGNWLENVRRAQRLEHSYHELAVALASAIDAREAERNGHSTATAYTCAMIGRALGLPESLVERLEFAGLLHALGRLNLPSSLLQKPGALTDGERAQVRAAMLNGAQRLENVEGLDEIAQMIRHQNERFDGQGSPDGLAGEAIPLGARILAVAVRFISMTRPRADRAAVPRLNDAFESLREEAGRGLDPNIIQAFLNAMGRRI